MQIPTPMKPPLFMFCSWLILKIRPNGIYKVYSKNCFEKQDNGFIGVGTNF